MTTPSESGYTPASIVAAGVLFRIPIYQRLFAWSSAKIKRLLSDLLDGFNKRPEEPYYVGIITQIGDEGKMSVIDGQQRLTALTLMAVAFARRAGDKSGVWRDFLKNGERLELFARPEDQRYLNELIAGAETGGYVNGQMRDALVEIEKFVDGLDDSDGFMDYVYNKTTILAATLPDSYRRRPETLNAYYENMNSTGKNLEQHEVLKTSLLIGQADKDRLTRIWNLCSDFARPLLPRKNDGSVVGKEEWLKLIDGDFSAVVAVGEGAAEEEWATIEEIKAEKKDYNKYFAAVDEGVINFPRFLLLALDLFKTLIKQEESPVRPGDFASRKNLIELFDALRPVEIVEFYEFALKLRAIIDYYTIRRPTPDDRWRIDLDDDEASEATRRRLAQYQSMLDVSTPYQDWLKPYLSYIYQNKNREKLDAKTLLDWLKRWDNERRLAGKSAEEVLAPANARYPFVDRYWFWRLDYYLWESNEENEGEFPKEQRDIVRGYRFSVDRSIEHLQPRNQDKSTIKWDENALDSFGNLAMISASFNSQQGNDDVETKFGRVRTQLKNKKLQSLKLLKMFNKGNWTETAAAEHERETLDFLKKTFSSGSDASSASAIQADLSDGAAGAPNLAST